MLDFGWKLYRRNKYNKYGMTHIGFMDAACNGGKIALKDINTYISENNINTINTPYHDPGSDAVYDSTALMYAAAGAHLDIVNTLLAVRGIDVGYHNGFGTALHYAVRRAYTRSIGGYEAVISALLSKMSLEEILHETTDEGLTALQEAKKRDPEGRLEIAKLIEDRIEALRNSAAPHSPSSSASAASSASTSSSSSAYSPLPSPSSRSSAAAEENTAPRINEPTVSFADFMVAAIKGGPEALKTVKQFIAENSVAAINFSSTAFSEETALMKAAFRGHIDIANALLAVRGINTKHVNSFRNSALQLAIDGKHMNMVAALLPTMTLKEISNKNSWGLTALKMAEINKLDEIVKMINLRTVALQANVSTILNTSPTQLKLQEELKNNTSNDTIPNQYNCPIGFDIMSDAIVVSDGHAYERKNLKQWFAENDKKKRKELRLQGERFIQGPHDIIKSPLTNQPIYRSDLEKPTCHTLQSLINDNEAVRNRLKGITPNQYLCPLGSELMTHPVVASDGHAYDRMNLTRLFEKSKTDAAIKSSVSGKLIYRSDLKNETCHTLQSLIDDFKKEQKAREALAQQQSSSSSSGSGKDEAKSPHPEPQHEKTSVPPLAPAIKIRQEVSNHRATFFATQECKSKSPAPAAASSYTP